MAHNIIIQEEVDIDPITEWRDPMGYPSMPDHFIGCPLQGDQLKDYFSLSSIGVTAFYLTQEKAMVDYFTNPPLTKDIHTSTHKKAKVAMAQIASSTMDTRQKVMRDFIGFSHHWLNLPITMEHVLNPQVVAKYFGFHVAKGNQETYMKVIATHLHQVAYFASSPHCPKTTKARRGDDSLQGIMSWYTNLNGSILASISSHYKAKERGITLWSVWQAVTTKWETFVAKLKVGGWWCLCGSWCWVVVVCCDTTHVYLTLLQHTLFAGGGVQVDQGTCKRVPGDCVGHDDCGLAPTTYEGGGLEDCPQLHLIPQPQGPLPL